MYVDKAEHDYDAVITEPTCTEHGFTTYSCKNCDDEYVSDYVDAVPHDYNAVVTAPTCTEMGFTSYTCKDCGNSYVNDYTNMVEHNYNKEVVEPTCTEHGYSVYTCPDCGKSYIGDYVDNKEHTYTETVVPPTCTTMGYTIFDCNDCDDSYKGNYIDALGHTPSDWIIDTPATIEHAGEKHIECTVCGEVMNRSAITQLADKDRTDEDGDAVVGGYDISLADENGKPIFDSEIIIDVLDNITIKLPGDRLLDYNDRTSITVTKSEEGTPAAGLNIYISDSKDNNATGKTDENGKLLVPNSASSTGDTNGTIGTEEDEAKMTYVVSITNKENVVIDNCDIRIGESNDIVIDLPDGLVLTEDSPAIVTVLDQNGVPQQGVDIIVIGDKDYIEKGSTDVYGKLTVPNVYEGYTDKDGRVPVNVLFDYNNRISVTVVNRADNTPVKDMTITATETIIEVIPEPEDKPDTGKTETEGTANGDASSDNSDEVKPEDDKEEVKEPETVEKAGKTLTGISDENGKVIFPPANEDITDGEGNSGITEVIPGKGEDTDGDGTEDKPGVNETVTYKVTVNDTKGVIPNALVKISDKKVSVTLPEGYTLTTSNQTTVTVKDVEDKAVQGVSVTITDGANTSKSGTTNSNGQVTLPVKSSGGGSSGGGSYSGGGGGGGSYSSTSISVVDKDGKTVSVSRSVSTTKATLTLPTGKTLEDGYYTITVKSGSKAKADYTVVLKDKKGNEATGVTDDNGVVTLPGVEHKAYIVGYPNGEFRPEGNMSRAEAAAIFARLIADEKGENITGKASFKDVASNEWYSSYVGYLEKYDVIKGYTDGTFKPEAPVTRAEFVAMSVRFYDLFEDVTRTNSTKQYTDVSASYWAAGDIGFATNQKWLNGYADGSFKPDININRAEVVTVVNRATGRTPDKEYISENYTKLDRFTDVKDSNSWYFFEVHEASNDHMAYETSDNENWLR